MRLLHCFLACFQPTKNIMARQMLDNNVFRIPGQPTNKPIQKLTN